MILLASMSLCLPCQSEVLDICDQKTQVVDEKISKMNGNHSMDVYYYYFLTGVKAGIQEVREEVER